MKKQVSLLLEVRMAIENIAVIGFIAAVIGTVLGILLERIMHNQGFSILQASCEKGLERRKWRNEVERLIAQKPK